MPRVIYHLGICYAAARDSDKAATFYERARQIQEKLVQDFPDNLDCRSDLALTLNKLRVILKDQHGREGETSPNND